MYSIYSRIKQEIIQQFGEQKKVESPLFSSTLFVGTNGVGKSILSFHCIQNYLELSNLEDLFFEENFIYLCKDLPVKEIKFLLTMFHPYQEAEDGENLSKEEKVNPGKDKNKDFHIIYAYKILFQSMKIINQFIYKIPEIKKNPDDETLESLSSYFFKIKSIFQSIRNQTYSYEMDNSIVNIANFVMDLSTNLKTDYIYIQEIQNIQKWINQKANFPKKVIMIEDLDKMSNEVANSFLKTLEEPPEGVLFFLTASSKENILSTILSRSSKYVIPIIGYEEYQMILEKEWDKDFIRLFGKHIQQFERFFDIAQEDKKRVDYIHHANQFIELLFDKTMKISVLYRLIKQTESLDDLLEEIIVLFSQLHQDYINKNMALSKDISIVQLRRISLFLDFLKKTSKSLNFSLEDGLIYLYINRERILNGDFDGKKLFL